MLRFVLLRHECPASFAKPSHWDFMLEVEDALQTWELHDLPNLWAIQCGVPARTTSETVCAVRLADHRLTYLDYQGVLSENRGNVYRYDSGTYELLRQGDDFVTVRLQGARLQCDVKVKQYEGSYQLTAKNS